MLTSNRPIARGLALATCVFVIGACSALPFAIGPSGIVPASTAAPLSRCDAAPAAICLITFGFLEPDQMLIELYVPAGSPLELYAKVTYKDDRSTAPCALALDSITTVYCTTALLPLGAPIDLEVYAAKTNVLLAKGEFVISALELPTQVIALTPGFPSAAPSEATALPSATSNTGFATSTPTTGSLFATLTPQGTPAQATPTNTPAGTSYPNQ